MRCPQCAERNSVAARKCEFCGEKFKKKPLPLGLKLAAGGIAIAVTASVAASYVVPHFVNPEQNLTRVAKRVAAGPTSVDQANKIKGEFGTAVKNFLKTSGDAKIATLTRDLQKLLPSSAFEVHVVELPRGLRVVEVDTVLQATSFLVMKTSSGTKVFDLPGFEVFDDARILNDSAGPVLALLGHTGGPPPHRPIVRTYALLPDYIADETDKLVPSFKVDGTAKFAKNGHDIHVEFSMPATGGGAKRKNAAVGERIAYGNLKWKDARYVSDFGAAAAIAAANRPKESAPVAAAGAVAAMPTSLPARPAAPVTSSAAVPAQVAAPSSKIVVRSFTAADAARSNPARAATQPTISAPDSVLAAVPMAAPALTNAKRTLDTITSEVAPRRSHRSTEASSPSTAQVVCSGATLRARPGRGSSAMNNFGRGTTVTVLGREADWTHVRVNGQEGYIFSSLLSSGGGTSVATTTQPQPAASSSSRSRRRARRDESVAVADAKPRASSRRQVATTEPILVP